MFGKNHFFDGKILNKKTAAFNIHQKSVDFKGQNPSPKMLALFGGADLLVGGRKHEFQDYFKALRGVVETSNFQGFLFKYLANQRCKEINTLG